MTTGTRYTLIPDVIDALLGMFGAAALSAVPALPVITGDGSPQEILVIDGEPTSDLPATYVLVGYSAAFAGQAMTGSSGLAVEGNRVHSDVGNRQFGESFLVWCEVSSAVGDTDPAAPSRTRKATAAVYGAMLAAIEADPTLQGIVRLPAYAAVSQFRWLLDQSPDGYAATVQFAVEVVGELWVPA